MKTPLSFIFTVLSLCLSFSVRAEVQEILKVHSDYFRDREYTVGLDVNDDDTISEMTFQESGKNATPYSLDTLKNFTTIFQVVGINMVQLRIVKQDSPTTATIELSTLYGIGGSHRSYFFSVRLNPASHQYELVDSRNQPQRI